MKVLTAALVFISLQYSFAVSPTDCNAAEPVAEKAVDLINKWRRSGYLFQLLRVADAHLDRAGSATIYYLALDVKESNCWVMSRNQEHCAPPGWPSDIVIGQCKVIVTRYSNDSLDLRMNDFNCTKSSVSSALGITKDSPVGLDYFEDTEHFRKQADKALDKFKSENSDFESFRVDQVERVAKENGGERTRYYLDFSVRNCSTQYFRRPPKVFGFCRADLSYNKEAPDLETPENIDVNCEVFNFEEHKNFSGERFHWGKHLFKPNGSRDHHYPHKPHRLGFPPPPEGKDNSNGPPLQEGASPPLPPPGSRCHHPPFGGGDYHPRGPPPHGPPPHGHHPHGPPPHGPPPHGPPPHGHHPHGPPPHGHHPHGPPPHGRGPHRHGPRGHGPHGRDFHDYGPCDPPSFGQGPPDHRQHGPPPPGQGPPDHRQHGPPPPGQGPPDHRQHGPPPPGQGPPDHRQHGPPPPGQGPPDHHHHRFGHGPPHRHSGEKGPGKGHFPFHPIGSVHRLPPLNIGEILPLPEANFPNFSGSNCENPLYPEIQPFPSESPSESCPGKFKSEFSQVSKFFVYTFPK